MKNLFSVSDKQANRKRIEKERSEESIEEKLENKAQEIPETVYKEPEINSFAKLLQQKNKIENSPKKNFSMLVFKNIGG